MCYLIAIILPPLAVLLCGKPFQFILNLIIFLVAVLTAVVGVGIGIYLITLIHAILVVSRHYADQHTDRIVGAIHQIRP